MWKPPERIKHALPEARWPGADEARQTRLFSPVQLGPMSLEERTWVPAMVPWRSTDEGFVTDDVVDWYRRFAEGQPGAIVVEATGIREVPSGPLLRIGHDRFVPGLRRLVETVREASEGRTRLLIQIIDFLAIRRRPEPEKFFDRYLQLTDRHRQALRELSADTAQAYHGGSGSGDDPGVDADLALRRALMALPRAQLEEVLSPRELEALDYGYRERVTDLHLPHIRELPSVLPPLFSAAARRAEAAGFDGVELHLAHAYTMASFLSALNSRDDGYGGSLEGRARLPLEVLAAVRGGVGDGFAIGCRYLTEDCLDGGSTVEDAAFFGVAFAKAGVDFLSLSRGGKFEDAKQPKVGRASYPYTGPSGYECMPTVISDAAGPFGRNLEPAATIRQALRLAGMQTPTVVAGGIATFEQAEQVLEEGVADVVAAARQSLADPDWFRKIRLGHGDDVRRCIFTNYCEGLDQMHKQVTCQLWDREDLGAHVARSMDGKRRLVAPAWDPESTG